MELERIEDELLNPAGGDPGVVIRLLGLQRILLFDLGEHLLSPGTLLDVSDLFVSHAHIDHFAGFDRLLRSQLGRTRTIRIHGGPGITHHVKGKLDGYIWNLQFEELVTFEVHELSATEPVRRIRFTLLDRFRDGAELEPQPASALALTGPGFRVHWAQVDHGTPSLCFSVTQADRYRFEPEALAAAGLQPGPALGLLKQRILSGEAPAEAERLGTWQRGRKVAYVTDCELNPVTLRGALAVARDADVMYCEATYPDREVDHAREVHHLTGGQTGALARACGAKRVVPSHFSRRYAKDPSEILDDLARGLNGATAWSEQISQWLAEDDHQAGVSGNRTPSGSDEERGGALPGP